MHKLLFFFVTLFALNGTVYSQNDQVLIKKVFDGYKAALLAEDGAKAVTYVDGNTINYYSKMKELALTGDSAEVASLEMIDQLMIIMIRHKITKTAITSMSGRDLFIYGVDKGLLGSKIPMGDIGNIQVSSHKAKAQFISNGTPTPIYFDFNQENKVWKLDLTSIFPVSNIVFQQIVAQTGLDEQGTILYLVERSTGKKPAANIWHPIR